MFDGNANCLGYIGFEICEDSLNDNKYFDKIYKESVELCTYLCKKYNLTEKDIICHSEGYKKGIASNHADVMHWFPKHSKNMDTFRADVKSALAKSTIDANSSNMKTDTTNTTYTTYTVKKGDTLWAIAQKFLGNGNRYP